MSQRSTKQHTKHSVYQLLCSRPSSCAALRHFPSEDTLLHYLRGNQLRNFCLATSYSCKPIALLPKSVSSNAARCPNSFECRPQVMLQGLGPFQNSAVNATLGDCTDCQQRVLQFATWIATLRKTLTLPTAKVLKFSCASVSAAKKFSHLQLKCSSYCCNYARRALQRREPWLLIRGSGICTASKHWDLSLTKNQTIICGQTNFPFHK